MKKYVLMSSSTFLAVFLAMSCGSSSSSPSTATVLATTTTTTTGVGSTQCANSEISVNGITCSYAPSGTFDSACEYSGGLVQTSEFNNGADICQTRIPVTEESGELGYIPNLIAGSTFGTATLEDTRYRYYPGDQLLIVSNTSEYGTYGGGLFPTCSLGTPSSTQGLYVADNIASYPAQAAGDVIAIQGTGYLQFGFNFNGTEGCSEIQLEFYLVRCMDSSGNIYTCPNTSI